LERAVNFDNKYRSPKGDGEVAMWQVTGGRPIHPSWLELADQGSGALIARDRRLFARHDPLP